MISNFTAASRAARAVGFALSLIAFVSSPAVGAGLRVVNLDAVGEGLNDPTPVQPIGGNMGLTIGEQRRIAAQFAADLWGDVLGSAITIDVGVRFGALSCDETSAALAFAGPNCVHSDFFNAPQPATLYPAALANALFGADLCPPNSSCGCPAEDISASFNGAIGTTCPFPNVWYYGLDGSPPATEFDFVTVFLHEVSHGLGFVSLVNPETGEKFFGMDDAFSAQLKDQSLNVVWPSLTDAARKASAIDTGDLVWAGPQVGIAGNNLLFDGLHPISREVEMYAPNPLVVGSSVSHFSTALTPSELMEPFYTGPDHHLGITVPLLDDIGWRTGGCGDLNGDGKIQAVDALLALRAAVSINPCNINVCDVNGSGLVTASDALAILESSIDETRTLYCFTGGPPQMPPSTTTTTTTLP